MSRPVRTETTVRTYDRDGNLLTETTTTTVVADVPTTPARQGTGGYL